MIDLGIWRCHDGVVLRLYGCECLFSAEEFSDLLINLRKVESGEANEILSQGYREIVEDGEARKRNDGQSLLKKLGLLKKVDLGELDL